MPNIKIEPLLLKREDVAELLGCSVTYLQRIRSEENLHFPEPIYFFKKSINTTPFWRLADIKKWVESYGGDHATA